MRFGRITLGLSLPTPWQRGFWHDVVSPALTNVGLGLVILHIERHHSQS